MSAVASVDAQSPHEDSEHSQVLLRSIRLDNLLSFAPSSPFLHLEPLNILIGANGAGKSNLIHAIRLLRATASALANAIPAGRVQDWLWNRDPEQIANVTTVVAGRDAMPDIQHRFSVANLKQTARVLGEWIGPAPRSHDDLANFYYWLSPGTPRLRSADGAVRELPPDSIDIGASVLSQFRDPFAYPEITYLAEQYARIRIYDEWTFGRRNPVRDWQSGTPGDKLDEDFRNLGFVLNDLQQNPKAKRLLLERLRDIYDGVSDYGVRIASDRIELFLTEGDHAVPATRLSDGTLRYLCLLAILCDPAPPPLICIEEPELGLHPDILPKIADLLVDASQRTQLIVTTHSDVLVDAMTERPDAVLVCEKHDGATRIERLSADRLRVWLEKYRLGSLWTSGQIGGTRW
jgi:predicted ATPase